MSLKKISTWELCQHSLDLNTKYPLLWLKSGLEFFYELWWISSHAPFKDSLFFAFFVFKNLWVELRWGFRAWIEYLQGIRIFEVSGGFDT